MKEDSPNEPSQSEDRFPSPETGSESAAPRDESTSEAAGGPVLSPSVVFGFLADERRRYVLYALRADGGHAALDELAEQVADWETQTRGESLTEELTQRVRMDLYHKDLPKLAEHDIVEFDRDSETVSLDGNASQVDHYVEFAKRVEQNGDLEGVM